MNQRNPHARPNKPCSSAVGHKELAEGYPVIAGLMSVIPEAAIFRRFTALYVQNALYLQADLVKLERELRDLEAHKDAALENGTPLYALGGQDEKPGDGQLDHPRIRLVNDIREKLGHYDDALNRLSHAYDRPQHSYYDLRLLQDMQRTVETDQPRLCGLDQMIWGTAEDRNAFAEDLSSIIERGRPSFEEGFSQIVTHWCYQLRSLIEWHLRWPMMMHTDVEQQNGVGRLKRYTLEKTVGLIVYWTLNGLVALYPIVTIMVLYAVRRIELQLMVIALFNIATMVCLWFFEVERRAEMFLVVITFSALEVVFVAATYEASLEPST